MADTIAAIATGRELSAIGIIRLSGEDAIEIIDRVFTPGAGGSMTAAQSRQLVYGSLADKGGELIDLCLCTVSRAPNSYTGENTAELQCHGSPAVLAAGLESLFAAGARQAAAGEFTKRAFLNGRMDLTQAEAVVDLINAETVEAAKNAAGQLAGAILRKADSIYHSLVDISSHYHAVIDYPDEDIEPFEMREYRQILGEAAWELDRLLESFQRGQIMKNGLRAAIVGRPNAGKSSLLNALLGYERAIVTDIPGTTRDTIEERVILGGVLLRLTDTAGLRNTDDPVERLGVDRARWAAEEAQLVLAVFDGSQPLQKEDMQAAEAALPAKNSIAVINKSDLPQRLDSGLIKERFQVVCRVSSLDKTGLDALGKAVSRMFPQGSGAVSGEILTNARQAQAVSRALEAVRSAIQALDEGLTPDAVLSDAEAAMSALGELTGQTVREDVTTRIFERFCVGK